MNTKDGIDRVLNVFFLAGSALLFAGVTLIPVQPVPHWILRDFVVQAVSLVLFAAAFWRYARLLHFEKADVAVLAGLAWLSWSVNFSVSPYESQVAFRKFLSLGAFWFFFRAWFSANPKAARPVENTWFFTAAVAALWVLVGFFRKGRALDMPFPNINIAAGFLGMFVAAGIWRYFETRSKRFLFFSVLCFLPWAAAQSRGALLAAAATAGLCAFWMRRPIEQVLTAWTKREWLSAGAGVLISAALLAPSVNRLLQAGEHDPYAYQRVAVWKAALEQIFDRPWTGFGLDSFKEMYPYYAPPELWPRQTRFAHQEYLQAAQAAGLPALLWILAVGVFFFRKAVPRMKEGDATSAVALSAGLLCAVHNAVDFTLHEWSLQLVLLFYGSWMLGAQVFSPSPEQKKASKSFNILFIVLVFFFMEGGFGAYRDWRSRRAYWIGLTAQQEGALEKARNAFQEALKFREHFSGPWNSLAALELAEAESLPESQREPKLLSALFYEERALRASPWTLTYRENHVEILKRLGRFSEALERQRRLVREAAWDYSAKVQLADLEWSAGHPSAAQEQLKKALQQPGPHQIEGWFLMGDFLRRRGHGREALEAYSNAWRLVQAAGGEEYWISEFRRRGLKP